MNGIDHLEVSIALGIPCAIAGCIADIPRSYRFCILCRTGHQGAEQHIVSKCVKLQGVTEYTMVYLGIMPVQRYNSCGNMILVHLRNLLTAVWLTHTALRARLGLGIASALGGCKRCIIFLPLLVHELMRLMAGDHEIPSVLARDHCYPWAYCSSLSNIYGHRYQHWSCALRKFASVRSVHESPQMPFF